VAKEGILDKITESLSTGSPQKNRISDYLIKNKEKAAMMSATQLAGEIGVSQPTLTRFVQDLGFSKFQVFQGAFQDLLLSDLTVAERFNLKAAAPPYGISGITKTLINEIKSLTLFLHNFPEEQFNQAAQKILKSERVCIVGTSIMGVTARHLWYYLSRVKKNISIVTTNSYEDYEKLLQFGPKDTVIAISTYRYSRETIELVNFVKKRDVSIVAITDSPASPISRAAQVCISVPISHGAIFDSCCAMFCLSTMMATQIASLNRKESSALLAECEKLSEDKKLYFKKELKKQKHASDMRKEKRK
jgi:DNA-binding MurR/RpiR family transcriptional regulator